MSTLEDRLRMAEDTVLRLKRLIATTQDPYPVGTVLRGAGHMGSHVFALRLATVHRDFAAVQRPRSDTPVWTIMWSDFSGSTFASFGELKACLNHIDWLEIYVPGKDEQ